MASLTSQLRHFRYPGQENNLTYYVHSMQDNLPAANMPERPLEFKFKIVQFEFTSQNIYDQK